MKIDWRNSLISARTLGQDFATRAARAALSPYRRYEAPLGYLRAPQLRADDVFLVSYPRSGNTWLRTAIAVMLDGGTPPASLKALDELVPDIHVKIPVAVPRLPVRVIKTHMPFPNRHESVRRDLYNKVIYAVRHPFDVLVSYYDYQCARARTPVGQADFARFVQRTLNYTDIYGSWQQHVLSWLETRTEREFLLVKYEDLMADRHAGLTAIASFLRLSLGPEQIDLAVENSSRRRMIEMEQAGSIMRADYEFVRRQELRRETPYALTPELKALILERCKEGLQACGYPLTDPTAQPHAPLP